MESPMNNALREFLNTKGVSLKDSDLNEQLIDYFENCHWDFFSDYEEAICHLFRISDSYESLDHVYRDKYLDNVSIGLQYAGIKGEWGKAYNGVKMICENAKFLSYHMICEILRYNINEDYSNRLRNIIIALIIDKSAIDPNDKMTLKFQFIDGYWLGKSFIDNVSSFINGRPVMYRLFKHENFNPDEQKPDNCVFRLKWGAIKNDRKLYLSLFQDERTITAVLQKYDPLTQNKEDIMRAQFCLTDNGIHVILKSENIPEYEIMETSEEYNCMFHYFNESDFANISLKTMDYTPDHFYDLNTQIADWLKIMDGYEEKFDLVYVYVENLYDLQPIHISMNSKILVDISDTEIKISKQENPDIPAGFFGKNVNSVHALIGKNGSGKSSLFHLLTQCEMFNTRPSRSFDNVKYFIIYKLGNHYYFVEHKIDREIIHPEDIFRFKVFRNTNMCLISNVYDLSCFEKLPDSETEENTSSPKDSRNSDFCMVDLTTNNRFVQIKEYFKQSNHEAKGITLKQIEEILYGCDTHYVEEFKKYFSSNRKLFEDIEGFDFLKQPDIKLSSLSSGEQARLIIFARLYSLFTDSSFQKKDNYIILFDEAELYMHPEWQRSLIHDILIFLNVLNSTENVYKNITLFFSSNSPFLMSDLPASNVHLLGHKKDSSLENTFGKQIYSLLKDEFFMQGGVIGKFAQSKIDAAFSMCERKSVSKEEREAVNYIYNILGDKLIKSLLKRRIEQNVSDQTS